MKNFTLFTLTVMASSTPAFAAGDAGWLDLANTNLVVTLAFLLFVAFLGYMGVHKMLGAQLENRAQGIKSELDEARALREEAQTILASYERKQKEVAEQADRIIEQAKEEASNAAKAAKEDMKASIARRLATAKEQIASAEAAAVKEVRDTAVQVAIAAASDVISQQMTAPEGNKLIDTAIVEMGEKLH